MRLAWGFYFPESIASYLEAARHDPDHPMPYWGMAHAMGPNPNSRYSGMPDDPKGEGFKAIKKAMDRIENASDMEAKLIHALHTLYDKDTYPDAKRRDQAYLAEMRKLTEITQMTQILQLYMRVVICQSKDGIIGEIKASQFQKLLQLLKR